MHRFFVASECIQDTRAHVEGEVARQAARVLRLHPGQEIVLLDNTGWEYVVVLNQVSPSHLEGDVVEKRRGIGDPEVSLTLYQGILKVDKLDMVLQKGTEIGISGFVPVSCHRSVPRTHDGWASSRYPRWRKIISEATEQSGRASIPVLGPMLPLQEALIQAKGVRLLAWEGDAEKGLRQALTESSTRIREEGLSLFVGPEGGFEPWEVDEARARGAIPVTLGRRILRGETAGLAMAAAFMFHIGELGG